MLEAYRRAEHETPKDHYVEPVVEDEPYQSLDRHEFHGHEMHFSSPEYHPREVEYEVDGLGHVHMYEETPEFPVAFL